MADLLITRRLFESLIESNPSLTDAEKTAKQVVQRKTVQFPCLLTTADATGKPIFQIPDAALSSTVRVVAASVTSPSSQAASGAVFYNLTVWKRDSAGANKTTICTVGMGAAGATAVTAFVPVASPDLTVGSTAASVSAGGLIGVDVAITGAPTAATGIVTLVLEGD